MKKAIVTVLILLGATIAFAEKEDESIQRARYDLEMKKMTNELNKTCGSSIEVEIDWKSFAASDWQKYSMPSFCGETVKALTTYCKSEKGNKKDYIKKNVKSITCVYGGEGKRALTVKNGKIKTAIDFKSANLRKFVNAQLLKNL